MGLKENIISKSVVSNGADSFLKMMFTLSTPYKSDVSFAFYCLQEMYPSEPVFVPNPEGVDEDDGVILSNVVCSKPDQHPFLLILDAKTFKETARAEVNNSS